MLQFPIHASPEGRRAAVVAAVVFALSLAATGCSSDDGDSSDGSAAKPPAVTATPTPDTALGLVLPVEPYLYSLKELQQLKDAEGTLTEKCMARFGFDCRAPVTQIQDIAIRSRTDMRYGIADPKMAASYGYHLGPDDPRASAGSGSTSAAPGAGANSPALTLVLTGGTGPSPDKNLGKQKESGQTHNGKKIPAGGCIGEARVALVGDGAYGDPEISRQIKAESFERSTQDSRTEKAIADWSACMKKAGYDYRTPLDAPGDNPRFNGPTASAEEIAMAVEDVECKRSSNVVGIWFAVESAYQKRLVEQKSEALAEVLADKKRTLKNAAEIAG